jgi:gluconate 2-dehydrogenase gamma chain
MPPERRHFLRKVITIAAVAGSANAAQPAAPTAPATPAPSPVPAVPAGYNFFSADEAAFVEMMVNVMCPADAYTPSGVDCGLALFIDRQLAGAYGQGAGRYMTGPWAPSVPQAGLQLPLTPAQFFSAGLAAVNVHCQASHGKPFDQLTPELADGVLHQLNDG